MVACFFSSSRYLCGLSFAHKRVNVLEKRLRFLNGCVIRLHVAVIWVTEASAFSLAVRVGRLKVKGAAEIASKSLSSQTPKARRSGRKGCPQVRSKRC